MGNAAEIDSDLRREDAPEATRIESAVHELYSRHCTLVWRSLRRLGVPASLVEDAVQDVFLVAHRRWVDFEHRASPSTWLYGIALHVAQEYRRREDRRNSREDRGADLDSVVVLSHEGPAEAYERGELNRLLHALLERLPREQRELLVLVDLEGLSAQEAAVAAGIRIRTCQRRLKEARELFNGLLRLEQHAERRTQP